jgi:hypothetical protein
MQVPSFLIEIQFGLISHKQFVAPVANVDGRGIDLVTVSYVDAVEVAANQYCH